MPYAPRYDPQYLFYFGSPSSPTTDPGSIYENYPGLQFTEGTGDAEYTIDPYAIEHRGARPDLLPLARDLAQRYGDLPPQPTELGLTPDDTQYVRDLAVFLNRSGAGVPIAGGKYGDNAGDGASLGSLLSNEFFIAALATGLAGAGSQLLATAPSVAPAGAAGAGAAASPSLAELGFLAPAIQPSGAVLSGGLTATELAAGLGGAGLAGGAAAGTGGSAASSIAPIAATPATSAPAGTFVAGGGGGLLGGGGFLGTGLTTQQALSLGLTGAGLVQAGIAQGNASDAQDRAADAARLQADLATQLFGETQPVRLTSLNALQSFLTSGALPPALQTGLDQVATTGREDLEQQHQVARTNLLSLTPVRGGQLNQALADLETSRARSVGRLRADLQAQYELPLRQALFGRATELGFGQANNSLAALGGSAGNLQALANAATQQAAGSGQAAGTLLALALKAGQTQGGGGRTGTSSLAPFFPQAPYTASPYGGGVGIPGTSSFFAYP